MARETIRRSDYSGKEIPSGTGARVRVMYYDGERVDRRADLLDEEVLELLGFTEEVKARPERRTGGRRL